MTNLFHYMRDGAGAQARAVLAYLQATDGIESSWNHEKGRYDAEPKIARWENCREQGYVISLRGSDYTEGINIAFFEHRNSDSICAVVWNGTSMNSPTIETANFGEAYATKWAVDHTVGYGKAAEMAEWILEKLGSFWTSNQEKKKSLA